MSPSLRTDVNMSIAFKYCSFGIPVIRSTISGVYREYCCFINWNTQRGCCSVKIVGHVWRQSNGARLAGSGAGA